MYGGSDDAGVSPLLMLLPLLMSLPKTIPATDGVLLLLASLHLLFLVICMLLASLQSLTNCGKDFQTDNVPLN
jgi:hypothetical protein